MSLEDRLAAIGPTSQVRFCHHLSRALSFSHMCSNPLIPPLLISFELFCWMNWKQEKKEFREYLHKYGVVDSLMRCTCYHH